MSRKCLHGISTGKECQECRKLATKMGLAGTGPEGAARRDVLLSAVAITMKRDRALVRALVDALPCCVMCSKPAVARRKTTSGHFTGTPIWEYVCSTHLHNGPIKAEVLRYGNALQDLLARMEGWG